MKPNISKVMQILFEYDDTHNVVIPLCNISMIEHKDTTQIKIFGNLLLDSKYEKINCVRAIICVTQDPRMEHAADWSDLGMFRFLIKLTYPKIVVGVDEISFIVNERVEVEYRLVDRQ